MTKKQLIEAIADYPDDAEVLIVYVANQVNVTVDTLATEVTNNNGAIQLMTPEFIRGGTYKRWQKAG